MTSEHEQDHKHAHEDDRQHTRGVGNDLAIGHASRSAQLTAPTNPVDNPFIHRKTRDANGVIDGADAAVARAANSSGQGLPEQLQRKFESSLGTDLSEVRVHTSSASAEANDAVGAKAYAVGQDIHFAEGNYDPDSHEGQTLVAHEVAHTVQQKGGGTKRQHKVAVSTPQDAAEHEADAAASAMVSGQSFAIAGVSRTAVFRVSQLPTPGTPALAEASRKGVLNAQHQTDAAIERVAEWVREQWAKYIDLTSESPKVVWKPSLLRAAIGGLAGAAIGKVASGLAVLAEEIPGAGVLVGMGIDMLGDGLKDVAVESIEGGKDLGPEEAADASRAAASKVLQAKLPVIKNLATSIKDQIDPKYQDAIDVVESPDVDRDTVDRLNAWIDADIAASNAIAPAGDALYQSMLLTWVTEHANEAGTANSETNKKSFARASAELFGAENVPNYWALQIREDLLDMGLPTTQADAKLSGEPGGKGGEMFFETAVDLDALARTFATENTPEFLHIAQGGQFQVHLVYSLLNEPTYTHLLSAGYTLATQGLAGGDKVLNHTSTHADMTRAP